MNIGIGIVRQEAGSCHIASRSVNWRKPAFLEAAVHGLEETGMFPSLKIHFHNPLHSVARGRGEHQDCVEIFVVKQLLFQRRNIFHMVKVHTDKS